MTFFTNLRFTLWYTLTAAKHLLILITFAIWWAVKHHLMKVKTVYVLAER